MSTELIQVIDQIVREKGINKDKLLEAIKSAIISASIKHYGIRGEVDAEFDLKSSEIKLYKNKTVVEKVSNPDLEVSLKDANKTKKGSEIGEDIRVQMLIKDFGRIAAQTARHVIIQKVRRAEQDAIYESFKDKKGELVSGVVSRVERGDVFVDLVKTEAILPKREQSFKEQFKRGDRLKAYILNVKKESRDPQIILSRLNSGFLTKLFELEVPEIRDGLIQIKGGARESSGRSKIAVMSHNRDVDPIGACVGMRGVRVQAIVEELFGEKIDIIEWSDDIEIYLKNALKPSKISQIICNREMKHMEAIVPDDQLSLAIGKKGQNVKLAVKLVQWSVDICKESDYAKKVLSKVKATTFKL